jgi:thioredoxin-like negative regulator of GroEL
MMDTAILRSKFEAGLGYDAYVRTGTAEQQRRWAQVYEVARPTDAQREVIGSFSREMKILIVSGIWCGDCVQQCPLIQRVAEANSKIELRLVDRDAHRDLAERVRINTGDRVPVVILMAEDFEFCALAGDRTLARYRALARKHLGAACPVAIGPPDRDEMAATLADWVNEIERVGWMLRLSSRLRQKHGD